MEVVLLLLGIVGIALVVVPRLQRRSSSGRRPTRGRRAATARRKRALAAAAAAPPVATWTPTLAPEAADEDGWDDDLGWEGVETAAPEARDAWEQWRATESPLAASEPEEAPAEPVAELPSVERWRAQAQEEEEWLEDDGLGWEGEDATWSANGHAPTPEPAPVPVSNGNGNGHVEPSTWTSGRDWTRSEEPAPAEPAVAAASASAATDVAPEPASGRSHALEEAEWDDEEPMGRPWGAPSEDAPRSEPTRTRSEKRKLHPVLLLAIYAAAGIGLVVLASTFLLGGSADPAPSKPPATRATPDPVRTPQPTPEATGSVADDPAALEAARAAEAKAQRAFRRERTRALDARRDAVDRARAAERRERRERAREARERRNRQSSNGGAGGNVTPQPTPTQPATPQPPAGGGGGGGGGGGSSRPQVCEFCIG